MVGAVCVLAAPFAVRAWWLSQLRIEVVSAQLENSGRASADAPDLNRWLATKNLRIRVRAHNGSRLPVTLLHAQYELLVSSVKAGSGDWNTTPDMPIEIIAVVPLSDPALRGALLKPPPEGVHLLARAWLTLRVAGFDWVTPIEQRFLVKPELAL
jgi:hypothetical protein